MFDKVMNVPRILNIHLRSEYATGSEFAMVQNMLLALNMTMFWIYRGSEYARVTQVSEYV